VTLGSDDPRTMTADNRQPSITRDAPVVSSAEAQIDAPVETVWEILTAVDRWPSWNPDVKSVSSTGPLATGSTFSWKAGPGTIRSVVEHLEAPGLVAWSGRTLSIRALHVWRLVPREDGTHVRTEESYDGLVARALRRPLQGTLDTALVEGLRHLKTEAERTARS